MSLDYRPDLPPVSTSLLQTATNVIPDKSDQYRTSYAATAVTNWPTALNATCTGSRMVRKADGTPFVFFGSGARIEEWNGVTLTNVSKGGGYTAGNRWWFCQYGDSTVASNFTDATQTRSAGTGTAFADLTNAPKAKVFLSQSGHLLALNYDDGSASPNGIKWSSQNSSTTWTATASNTAGNAILRESPGEITAGAELHDIVVVWKKYSMYIGKRIGGSGTDIWQFNLLAPKIGIPNSEAWVSTPVGLIFASTSSGIFRFDGSTPVPIDRGIRSEIYKNLGNSPTIHLSHDEASSCVFVWLDNSITGWSYNYITDKWGKAYSGSLGLSSFTNVNAVVRDANYPDYVTLGGDSDTARRRSHLVVTTEKKVCNLNGLSPANSLSPSFVFQNIRDPKATPTQATKIFRAIPIFGFDSEGQVYREPTAGMITVTPRSRMSGGNQSSSATVMNADKWFDGAPTANSFQVQLDFANESLLLQDVLFVTKIDGDK